MIHKHDEMKQYDIGFFVPFTAFYTFEFYQNIDFFRAFFCTLIFMNFIRIFLIVRARSLRVQSTYFKLKLKNRMYKNGAVNGM